MGFLEVVLIIVYSKEVNYNHERNYSWWGRS